MQQPVIIDIKHTRRRSLFTLRRATFQRWLTAMLHFRMPPPPQPKARLCLMTRVVVLTAVIN